MGPHAVWSALVVKGEDQVTFRGDCPSAHVWFSSEDHSAIIAELKCRWLSKPASHIHERVTEFDHVCNTASVAERVSTTSTQ